MNETEHKNLLKRLKESTERVKTDKEYALKILIGTGMFTPKGKLKRRFQ